MRDSSRASLVVGGRRTREKVVVNESELSDRIAGARAYEGLHVPALFQQWCPRVLDAAGVEPGNRVLDVACGTGVLAREAALRVGPAGHVSGVDPGRGMLAVAAELAPYVEWREATAESLPYPDESFDAVVSQFGLMFFSDRSQALREMVRVLNPGGRLAVAVWDSLENSDAYPIEVELLERLAGEAAADALRAPFVLGDTDALTALFEGSGLTAVGVQTKTGTARFPSIRTMVEADLRGWLPVMGVLLEDHQVQNILEKAELALADYVTGDGDVVFDAPAHIVTGAKP
jgi:SAM-dependent methyltransferase